MVSESGPSHPRLLANRASLGDDAGMDFQRFGEPGHSVTLERLGKVAIVSLDRPERRNALDEIMWNALEAATIAVESSLPRAVIITGAGTRAFSAGMDVSPDNPLVQPLLAGLQAKNAGPAEVMLRRLREVVDRFVALPVPTIAAVSGLAYGGGAEIAARCDLRVIDPSAVICFSETRLGLMPDLGGGVALVEIVGRSRAADLILTARKVGAAEALALGLVNRVSAPGACVDEAIALAEAIAENGPRAVRASLRVNRGVCDRTREEALEHELREATELIATGEFGQGVSALFAKTPPRFDDP